ncbi:tyrosine-type recombinase/integrase [Candidatus Saccharibacteria bacterium]|nr:tyrosine-type recombinase/integrase [Candidatus Saccharibacteria bacterium]
MKSINRQIAEYFDYCEKVRCMSPATLIAKRSVINCFIRATKITNVNQITNEIFNNWMKEEQNQGVSSRTLNTYNSAIITMVKYFRSARIDIPLNLALVKKLKEGNIRRKFYTEEEIATALLYADTTTSLIIRIMFETGMRIAEITHLRLRNIDGQRINFIGKGNKPREVYITQQTQQDLAYYISENDITDYVWSWLPTSTPPAVATVRLWLKKAFTDAGMPDFYPHSLRHSFATDLQRRGASVAEIKEMIGHESIATTERYLHGFEGRMEELFKKYRK